MYQYPYGDTQQLNLDWILTKIKELESGGGSGGGSSIEDVANALISLTYSPAQAYNISDIVFHEGHLYRCNTIIPAPGEIWNPSHWDQIMIGDTVANLVRAVASMNSDNVFNESNVNGIHLTDALNALVEDIRYNDHWIQQKKNGSYADAIEIEDTPSNSSSKLASSKAVYDLKETVSKKFPIEIADLNLDDIGALIGGVKPTAANRPIDAGNFYGTVWHYASTANYATQIYQETGTNDSLWMRKKYNGIWGNWVKIITASITTETASLVDPLPAGVTGADVRYIKCGQMVTVYAYVQRDANALTSYVAVATNLPKPAGNPYLNNAAYAPLVQAFVFGTHTGRPLLSYVQTNGEFRISRGETAGSYYFSYSYITSDI